MTDRARELLDRLLGPTRDLTEEEVENLRDTDNCIFLLAGFCPFKALEHTRMDIGQCPYSEHKEVPAKYMAPDKLKLYETELLGLLEMVAGLFENRRKKAGIKEQHVNLLAPNLEEKVKMIVSRAKEGKMDESLELAEKLEAEHVISQPGNDGVNKTHFCEVCAATISNVVDSKEYKVHINGRLHQACVRMRTFLAHLLLKYKFKDATFLTNKKRQQLSKLERINYKKRIL
ncbi:Spliceosome subunit [Trachipleistophora hominis]|uniref:Spliceosome subunit n=1 Tax=Trachipleistophora hominis TaxID=72359 RepID=L7JUS2_TRAHO|nr:Spliceosome subunit [Trachipleistophora hominis]